MKRFLLITTLISVMLIGACKTTSPITTQEQANDALQEIYNNYRSDLILDGAKSYTVVRGDTLAAISRAQYNNGFYFPIIMLASSEVVLDPDLIEPGMQLTVPDLQRNLNDAKAKGKIKSFLGEIAGVYDRRDRPQDADGLRDLADTL
ncbi:hypothetical protein AGMMS50293_01570 [Spirochaetia bacterium]|nr:hypothetical protein AGMMS50293_01570 [Spirochaetia bacterium]